MFIYVKTKNRRMEIFLETQRRLLDIEHAAELQESTTLLSTESNLDLQNRGIAILGLTVSGLESGLFGKTVVSLVHHLANSRKHDGILLAANSLTSGDIVGIFGSDSFKGSPIFTGVVHAICKTSLKIVLDGDDEAQKLWDYSRFNVAKIGSNVTHVRLSKTVDDLERSFSSLKRLLFEETECEVPQRCVNVTLRSAVCENLNIPQRDAVCQSLSNPLIALIQGPPGTGKTTTVAAVIAEAVLQNPGIKILACAPSNVAVDNLAVKVLDAGVKSVIRVGHPTRMQGEMLKHCLDAKLMRSDLAGSCVDIRNEIQAILDSRKGYSGLKEVRKELRERESKSIEQVVKESNVIFTTCNGAFNLRQKLNLLRNNPNFKFDMCIIDECAQGLEMSCWIPILQADRTVLAGDHKQLCATIHSKEAESEGLGFTLFERCFNRFKSAINLLTIQYRMNAKIMNWSSREFYNQQLIADKSVENQTLQIIADSSCMVNGVDFRSIIESPFVFCDSNGVDGTGEDTDFGVSKSNRGEAAVVKTYADLLMLSTRAEITIITPYSKQVEVLQQRFLNTVSVSVSTVDSFQGRESDVVILSLVRSNFSRQVGFLADYRRLNVAVTRARKQVFIVGDSETISSDPILKSLFDYACDFGTVISAQSFLSEHDIASGTSKAKPVIAKPTSKSVIKASKPHPKEISYISSTSTELDNRTVLRSEILAAPNDGTKFLFPKTLSNSDRRHIHSICDQLGISHGSVGEGPERQVWILKNKDPQPVKIHHSSSSSSSSEESDLAPPEIHVIPDRTKPFEKKKSILLPLEKVSVKPHGICPYENCKMSVRLISLTCALCKRDFCVAHATPEVHGCGDAAKKAARLEMKQQGAKSSRVLKQGKGGVSTAKLKEKINAKLECMQSKRSSKKK